MELRLDSPMWPLAVLAPFLIYFALRFAYYASLKVRGLPLPFDQEMFDRGESLLLGQTVRQVYAWSLQPLVRLLTRARVRPNSLTLGCFVISTLGGLFIGLGWVALGGVVAFAGSSLDYFDGRIARATGQVTQSGAFLDSTLDRYCEVAFLAGAGVLFRDSPWTLATCLLAMGCAGIVSYTRAKAESLGIELKSGLMQRPERVVIFCAGASFGPALDDLLPAHLQGDNLVFAASVYILGAFTALTSAHRTTRGYALLLEVEKRGK